MQWKPLHISVLILAGGIIIAVAWAAFDGGVRCCAGAFAKKRMDAAWSFFMISGAASFLLSIGVLVFSMAPALSLQLGYLAWGLEGAGDGVC